jgi:Protein of unknown function (DUF2510)
MSSTETPPGWHPDPENPTVSMRWWDGALWTSDVRPIPGSLSTPPPNQAYQAPGAAGYGSSGPYGSPGNGGLGRGYGHQTQGPYGGPGLPIGQATFARRNQRSLTATGVAVLYIVIAISTRFVFFGIFPLLLSYRAWQAREVLAPLAVAVTAVAIIVGVAALTAH